MAKLTRKSYQRKAMVIGATAFAGMALVATGFAAWVISSSATKNISGGVTVSGITDKSITLNAEVDDDFSFDSYKDDNTGRVRWDGTNSEKLKITLTGDYDNADKVNSFSVCLRFGSITEGGDITYDTEAEDRFAKASESGENQYIVLPECFKKEVTFDVKGVSDNADSKYLRIDQNKASFGYDIEFNWGSHFGGMNPSLYYDSTAGIEKYSDDAYKQDLIKFYEAMTGEKVTSTEDVDLSSKSFSFVLIVKASTSAN